MLFGAAQPPGRFRGRLSLLDLVRPCRAIASAGSWRGLPRRSRIAAPIASAHGACTRPPNGVKTLAPAGAIKSTGTWNLGTRAGDFIYVAGMRGIDPKTDTLVQGDEARLRQAFLNMKLIAESEGATLRDAVRLVVYVTTDPGQELAALRAASPPQ